MYADSFGQFFKGSTETLLCPTSIQLYRKTRKYLNTCSSKALLKQDLTNCRQKLPSISESEYKILSKAVSWFSRASTTHI